MIGRLFFFFFFKQKTAYEMRISDWSSDVCSSDLLITASTPARVMADPAQLESALANLSINSRHAMPDGGALTIEVGHAQLDEDYVQLNPEAEIGRASCRERVCQYV